MTTDTCPAPGPALRRVAMLIHPGVDPLDVAGPLQVFGVANLLRKRQCYEIVTVAPTVDPVPTAVGLALVPSCAMAALPFPLDTLLVPGGGGPEAGSHPDILEWLRRAAPRTRRFGSICTGAFALGAAGLLDGKRVTTHWAYGAELARRHPTSKVEIDSLFVRDGALFSSGGLSAGIDLALSLLEDDHGPDLALDVARYLVLVRKRSGGQTQFPAQLQAQFSSLPAIQRVQLWCHANLDGNLRVDALAKRAAMSERSFIRAFRRTTGQTPAHFVTAARLQAACRLIEDSGAPPKAIAERCGFGSPAAMRRIFVHHIGVTPTAYGEQVRGRRSKPAQRSPIPREASAPHGNPGHPSPP